MEDYKDHQRTLFLNYCCGFSFIFSLSSPLVKFIEAFKRQEIARNYKRKIIFRLDNKLKKEIENTELTQGFSNLLGISSWNISISYFEDNRSSK